LIGRFEDGCAHQYLQVGDHPSGRVLGFKAGDQLLDLFVLRKEDWGRGGLFFNPAANSARVRWMTIWAYWSVKFSNC
jgi:hypothetical protein